MRNVKMWLVLMMLAAGFSAVYADVPHVVNYQGMLKDNGVPVNGTKSIVFKLYDSLTGGTLLWTSPAENITIIDGLYTYKIGSSAGTPDFSALNWSQMSSVYLEVVVSGTAVSPRVQLVSVPFALTVADGAITSSKISNNAVTTSKIIDNGVVSNKIANNAITLSKLNSNLKTGAGMGLAPSGSIIMWPVTNAPSGWLECGGQAVSRTTYADLFSVIGTMYGTGDGSTTFNLPDFRGYFVRGWNHGASVDPDTSTRTNYATGQTGNYIGTRQHEQYKSHSHSSVGSLNGASLGSPTGGVYDVMIKGPFGSYPFNTASSGGNETRPKNIYMMYIIKY
ncbi:MAG: tail fiber protein [bacterium]|nr:tail fiber protein [bacterium]